MTPLAPQAAQPLPDPRGTTSITGPRKKNPSFTLRRVFVHSSARAAAATARVNKLDRARDDLARLSRGLGSRHYPTTQAVTARNDTIARERRVGDYLRTTIGTDHNGRPTLHWHLDQNAIDAEAATDGWYALLTNLPATITTAQALTRYKTSPAPANGDTTTSRTTRRRAAVPTPTGASSPSSASSASPCSSTASSNAKPAATSPPPPSTFAWT